MHLHQTISNPSETPRRLTRTPNAVSRLGGGEAEDVSINDLTASSSLRTAGGARVRRGASLEIRPILDIFTATCAPFRTQRYMQK